MSSKIDDLLKKFSKQSFQASKIYDKLADFKPFTDAISDKIIDDLDEEILESEFLNTKKYSIFIESLFDYVKFRNPDDLFWAYKNIIALAEDLVDLDDIPEHQEYQKYYEKSLAAQEAEYKLMVQLYDDVYDAIYNEYGKEEAQRWNSTTLDRWESGVESGVMTEPWIVLDSTTRDYRD